MIDLIFKIDNNTLIVLSNGEGYYYEQTYIQVMNTYLKPLLLDFNTLMSASKMILGEAKYKRPFAYHDEQGINVFIPTCSRKSRNCIFVSLHYLSCHGVKEFNEKYGQKISNHTWNTMIGIAITYRNMFTNHLEIPFNSLKIENENIKKYVSS